MKAYVDSLFTDSRDVPSVCGPDETEDFRTLGRAPSTRRREIASVQKSRCRNHKKRFAIGNKTKNL